MAEDILQRQQRTAGANRLTLMAGLGLGGVAAILIALVLSGNGGGGEKIVPATRVAVVAAQDIPAQTRLTPEMLKVQTFEIDKVNPDAFTTVAQLNNRVTASAISSGATILPSQVSTTAGQGLTFTVNPGLRAVSIGVKEVVTAGGNIAPGNRVDIVGVFDVKAGVDVAQVIASLTGEPAPFGPTFPNRDVSVTFTLLQNVRVLAVAQNLPNQTAPSTGQGSGPAATEESNPRAATVTLEVTPQQAQIMALADNRGTLRLSLRPFGEDSKGQVSPIVTVLD